MSYIIPKGIDLYARPKGVNFHKKGCKLMEDFRYYKVNKDTVKKRKLIPCIHCISVEDYK